MSTQSLFSPKMLVIAIGSLLTVACGNNSSTADNKTEPQQNTATQTNTTDTSNSTELHATQEVVINNQAEIESADPHKISGAVEGNVIRQMLVGLTTSDNNGNTVAGMAEKWETADNKVWTFHLRDAKWSNGDAVTANDFVYSFRRSVDPNTASPYASYLADAKVAGADAIINGKASVDTLGVKAIDDKTLEITLTEAVPYFADMLIHTAVMPVHPATVDKFGDKWTDPANIVVNGPYKLSNWIVNDHIELMRNEAYYDNANTTINKITFLPIPAHTTAVARFEAGEVDWNDVLPSGNTFKELASKYGTQMQTAPKLCTYYFAFNHTKPPFNDVKVRRALSLATDREMFVNQLTGAGEKASYQFVPVATQGNKAFEPAWKSMSKDERIAEAKKLLSEAGYSEANPLKFEFLYNTDENNKKYATAMQSIWKKDLGVEVTLTNQEWKTYLDTLRQQKFEIARSNWCADYNESSTFLNLMTSTNSNNDGKYTSAEYDTIMAKTLAAGITDDERAELYRQAEEILDKDVAAVFVYQRVGNALVKPYIQGYSTNDPTSNYQVKYWKIGKH